jgi:hypothetical protein
MTTVAAVADGVAAELDRAEGDGEVPMLVAIEREGA